MSLKRCGLREQRQQHITKSNPITGANAITNADPDTNTDADTDSDSVTDAWQRHDLHDHVGRCLAEIAHRSRGHSRHVYQQRHALA